MSSRSLAVRELRARGDRRWTWRMAWGEGGGCWGVGRGDANCQQDRALGALLTRHRRLREHVFVWGMIVRRVVLASDTDISDSGSVCSRCFRAARSSGRTPAVPDSLTGTRHTRHNVANPVASGTIV
eukprot:304839-Prymnesium_polylepis.1